MIGLVERPTAAPCSVAGRADVLACCGSGDEGAAWPSAGGGGAASVRPLQRGLSVRPGKRLSDSESESFALEEPDAKREALQELCRRDSGSASDSSTSESTSGLGRALEACSGSPAAQLHADLDPAPALCMPRSCVEVDGGVCGLWEGVLKHRLSPSTTLELFGLSLRLPAEHLDLLESLPPTLFVHKLLPPEALETVGADLAPECRPLTLSQDNAQTIAKMAETCISILVELQDCKLWLRAGSDGGGKLGVRCLIQRTC